MACGPAPSSRGLGRDGGQQHRGHRVPGGRARPALQRRRRATAGRGPRPARRPEPVAGGAGPGRRRRGRRRPAVARTRRRPGLRRAAHPGKPRRGRRQLPRGRGRRRGNQPPRGQPGEQVVASAVIATTALLGTADDLLAGLAAGRLTAALAIDFAAMPPAPDEGGMGTWAGGPWPVRVGPPEDGDAPGLARLSGTARGVAGALAADVLLVPGDGVPLRLYAVAAAATEVSREAVVSLDAT